LQPRSEKVRPRFARSTSTWLSIATLDSQRPPNLSADKSLCRVGRGVLRDLQAGGLKFTSIEIANVNVRIYGQTALLTDSQTMTSRGGKEAVAHLRLVAAYVAEGGRLRLAYFQSVSLQ
jgi:hypothetical protein